MAADPAWLVPGPEGTFVRSPLTTPFASPDLKRLLRIASHRTIATQGYGMVAQLRSWLPDPIGGIYWFYHDNPFVSAYVPVYAGVRDVAPAYKIYDYAAYSEDSARWAVDFVEKLLHLRWQEAVNDLHAARDPLEEGFFSSQAEVEAKALDLLKKDPVLAAKYLTDLTVSRMNEIVKMFRRLRDVLLSKYTGDVV